ncbi:MAG: iron complex transport system substrate-binding protein [Pirellulaceae bacterium]|jgi:iron complex transport system substrate-binding protein
MRIISLLSGATEILFALGLGDHVVGVGHECDYPPQVSNRPRLTLCHIDINQQSQEIDQQVKSRLAEGRSLYEVKRDELIALRPDLIVTQAQCDVCAVSYNEVIGIVSACPELSNTQIVALNPSSLDDVFAGIQSVADAANVAPTGRQLNAALRERLELVATQAAAVRPTVACIEWVSPLMFAGNWTPQLIEFAGGESQLAKANQPSEYATFENLLDCNPEFIIVAPCGFDIERSLIETRDLQDHPRWTELAAVQNRRVYVIDGNQYLNRSGPRLVDTVEILANIIQGGRHENAQWINLAAV